MSSTTSAERRRPRPDTRTRRSGRRGGAEGLDRLRILLASAMGAVLVGYALLVPVAGILLASGGTGSLDGAFAVAVPMWLAAHQLPVEVDGRTLGVLPLVPTGVVVAVVAVASAWSVRRLGGRVRHDAGAVVAVQAGAAAAVAVLAGALLPGDVAVATPWSSMIGAGLLAGLAAGIGVLRVCGLPAAWSRRLDGWPRASLAGARAGATGLVASGALVLLVALVVHAGAVAESFASLAPGAGAGAGALLLVVGYLPNTLAGAVAWALGPGVAVGAARFGPFGTVPGPLPRFPLFAVLPADPSPAWAVLVLLLPLAVGVAVGRACRRVLGDASSRRDRLAAAGSAAALVAVGAGAVAGLAGGSLGGGPYDPVSLSPFAVLAAALVLLGVPATIACTGLDELLAPPRRTAGRPRRPGPGSSGRTAARGGATRAGTPDAGRSRSAKRPAGARPADAGLSGGNRRETAARPAAATRPAPDRPVDGDRGPAGRMGPTGAGDPAGDASRDTASRDTASRDTASRDTASRDTATGASSDTADGAPSRDAAGRVSRDTADGASPATVRSERSRSGPRTVADLVAERERDDRAE